MIERSGSCDDTWPLHPEQTLNRVDSELSGGSLHQAGLHMGTNKTTIHQLLDEKGNGVWTIDPDDSIFNAVTEMSIKDVGGLLVTKDEKIVGIITERDYTRNVILKGKTSAETPVCEIMSENVIFAAPEYSVSECLEIMTEKRIRHLPVVDNDRLIGMISIGDLVKQVITDQQTTIEKLENANQP